MNSYFSGVFLYGLVYLLLTVNGYFSGYFRTESEQTFAAFFIFWLLVAPFWYWYRFSTDAHFSPDAKKVVLSFGKLFQSLWHFLKAPTEKWSFSEKMKFSEKTSVLKFFVKLFFLPLMINFFWGNFFGFVEKLHLMDCIRGNFELCNPLEILSFVADQSSFYWWYGFLFSLLFLIDVVVFMVGYAVESPRLKNVVKSVEPTFLGWFVAIMCYPPFNGLAGDLLGWYSEDYFSFELLWIDQSMHVLAILLIVIYVWATVALGWKASNLTNRGIVWDGPYRFIRHPAYISKTMFWMIGALPIMITFLSNDQYQSFFLAVLSVSVWTGVYFLRALTEERHLLSDPEYVKYCKKVKYRFIPGVL